MSEDVVKETKIVYPLEKAWVPEVRPVQESYVPITDRPQPQSDSYSPSAVDAPRSIQLPNIGQQPSKPDVVNADAQNTGKP